MFDLMSSPQVIDLTTNFVQIIDGAASTTKETRHGVNPATLNALEEVPLATQQDLDRAVDAAKEAFKSWSKIPYNERQTAVLAYAAALHELRSEFGELLTLEQGKPVCPTRHKVMSGGQPGASSDIDLCSLPKQFARQRWRWNGRVDWLIYLCQRIQS